MSSAEDQWCDWCGDVIPAQMRRVRDGRVFCRDECLAGYLRGADAPTVTEIRPNE